ncbi:glycoside hydrolase family 36 protein [Dysgonomonas sp. Marseille-P4361]|uniref:glycoside hydrolase family 36 protein n=1 Tax=Dysgonomonas sp. Marseille-P4361 TaxID=2161820 RepID=UPI000D5628E4|nr:glycoside hydrolase family 36 protein [Dysgonomonas sp. Marseille-P4361]
MYKRLLVNTTILLFLLGLLGTDWVAAQQKKTYTANPVQISQWINSTFARGKTPPFSFVYDGVESKNVIRSWSFTSNKLRSEDPNVLKYRFTYESKRTGLRIDCDVDGYTDFNAVKWVLYFTNIGDGDSKTISDLKVIDLDFEYVKSGDFILHSAEGNHISKADFHPRSRVMAVGENIQIAPEGGRSSEVAFPFFNIESPADQGFIFAVGWSGTWGSDFVKKSDKSITVKSGMKRFESYLKSGETIRTPSMCLMFWNSKNRIDGHNKFRRFVLAHQSRKIDGKFAKYPLSSGFNYRDPAPCTEYSCLTADYAIAMIRRYTQFGLVPEVYWLDAGWYTGASNFENGQTWANTVGNWTVDKYRFPNGLKPISDEAHKVGAKFMVWFEPERVIRGTQWAEEHPEWMLDIPNSNKDTYLLFDLGNEDARKWMTKWIIDMMHENGIDYYRQDFNMQPDIYWEANDEPGRAGIKEIRHIEGLYAFWDDLLKEFPNMLIDNCASGGRRLDLETISRSAPLWRSDYYHYDDPDGYQGHTYGLNYFLPLHGTGILQTDKYSFRSSMSSALIYNWKITDKHVSYVDMQSCLNEYADIRSYYYEDYYPLVGIEDITRDNIWVAYQLHKPSDESGVVVAFRREKCNEDKLTVKLGGVLADKSYIITNKDNSDFKVIKTGKELSEGFDLKIDNPRGSLLLHYTLVN